MIELAAVTKSSTAAARDFFACWTDHASWSVWSPDTEWARVNGPVREGVRGVLKPKGGPKTSFVVIDVQQDHVYTDVSAFPGARLTFRHAAEPTDSGSTLSVRVWLDGPLSWLWARTACKGFRQTVPADLDRLISLVEKR